MNDMSVAAGKTAAEKIGAFVASVRPENVAPEVVRQGARSFIDTIGISIGAIDEPGAQIVTRYVTEGRCGGPSTVWTTGQAVQPEDAALANGILAHALDYDHVTAKPGRGHPAVVIWPALIALGQKIGANGRQLSTAYAVGYEMFMMSTIRKILDHYAKGHHITSTSGLISTTAAAANLMGLTAEQTTMAIGMAVSHASGVQANFGTMTKPLHAGNAAAAAIRCVELAALGFTASADALDAPNGFAGVYSMPDLVTDMDELGREPLAFGRLGFSVKKFPCCLSVHISVQAVLNMLAEAPINAADVERITVAVEPGGTRALIHHRPTTGLQGKFSMEYCVAAALLDGDIKLESFTDEAVQRPEVQELLRKVESGEDGGEARPLRSAVEITLRNGERRSFKLDTLPGSPEQPLSDAEVEQKFRDCAAFSGLKFDVDGFLATARTWDDRPIGSVLGVIQNH